MTVLIINIRCISKNRRLSSRLGTSTKAGEMLSYRQDLLHFDYSVSLINISHFTYQQSCLIAFVEGVPGQCRLSPIGSTFFPSIPKSTGSNIVADCAVFFSNKQCHWTFDFTIKTGVKKGNDLFPEDKAQQQGWETFFVQVQCCSMEPEYADISIF